MEPGCPAPAALRAWLAVVVAVLFVLAAGCGPAGPGNGSGNGGDAGNGGDHGAPGDAGSGAVADLGGAYGVTALVDGRRYTVTETVLPAPMAGGTAFTFAAGDADFEAYWAVNAALNLGPQPCGDLAVPFFIAGLPNGEISHFVAVDCTIQVDAFEVVGGDEFGELALFASITGRFSGTMQQYRLGDAVVVIGPIRMVTNGVFHYVAEP